MAATKVEIKGNKMIITMDINPKPSSSGKNIVIASTSGNHECGCQFEGHPVVLGVNAYYKPAPK